MNRNFSISENQGSQAFSSKEKLYFFVLEKGIISTLHSDGR